jgi:hypothetical protein
MTLERATENSDLEILREGSACPGELLHLLQQTAEFYRAGDLTRGSGLFLELIQGMERLVNIASVAEQRFKTACDDRTFADAADSINRILLEIIGAQEQRDWVLLTDLLEYELAPQLELWVEIFTTIRHNRERDISGGDGLHP